MKKLLPLLIYALIIVVDGHDGQAPYEWFVIDNSGQEFNMESSTSFWTVAEAKADWENVAGYLKREWRYVDAWQYKTQAYNKGRYWKK